MDARIVKLDFLSPVHFGDGRLSGGRPTCDAATLFSALYIEALRMGCADELLDAAESGELFLSDAFPYIGDELYLPKPMLSVAVEEESKRASARGDSRAKKAFKKLEYVRLAKLGAFLDGTMDPISELDAYDLGSSALQVKVNLARESSEESEPYSVGSYSFKDGAGIYFIVCGSSDIGPLMNSLQYSGLGGKRNSGYGRFKYSIEDAGSLGGLAHVSSECKETATYVLLSSAIPEESEMNDELIDGSRTKVVKKGGFVQSASHATTPQKKRDLFVFAPGSVFTKTFEGAIIDANMTEGAHPVYRYAKALWMEVR